MGYAWAFTLIYSFALSASNIHVSSCWVYVHWLKFLFLQIEVSLCYKWYFILDVGVQFVGNILQFLEEHP